MNSRRRAHDSRGDWFNCVEATVAEVNFETLEVKVIIPAIDENLVHNVWIPQLVPWVGPPGYGPFCAPAVGSEVVLMSRLNEGVSLFYLSRYNEDFTPPAESADGSRGFKSDGIVRLLCDVLFEIASGTQVLVRAAQRADVQAPDVFLRSEGGTSVHGQGAKVGFLGAAPVARQALPGPASDLPSCIALSNAIRAALVNLGLCQ
ncbi:MAG TPA: hypothetical protein VGV38_17350 [Pyrinomonadaceae bacterium]|nr:hypothetical protein [Pyrinomonadaceae bacterium]